MRRVRPGTPLVGTLAARLVAGARRAPRSVIIDRVSTLQPRERVHAMCSRLSVLPGAPGERARLH